MKNLFTSFILFFIFAHFSVIRLIAQGTKGGLILITTDLTEIPASQYNGQVQVMPLRHFGINFRAASRAYEEVNGQFTNSGDGFLFGGELKFFPFGSPRNWDIRNVLSGAMKQDFEWDENFFERYLRGFYVALGYEHKKTNFTLIPAFSLTSPIESFQYEVVDNGATFHFGYGFSISHLYIGIGYRNKIHNKNWSGPMDIFTREEMIFPASLQQGSLQVDLGLMF